MREYVCPGCDQKIESKASRQPRLCQRCNALKNIRSGKMRKQPTHGQTDTRLYGIWNGMKQRCTNPNRDSYQYYGGRGIGFCDGWASFEPFAEWARSSGYAPGLTLERQDGDGNYEPDNCCWVTHKQQCGNRRNARRIEVNGVDMTFQEAGKVTGINWRTLYKRIVISGWPVEKALGRESEHLA